MRWDAIGAIATVLALIVAVLALLYGDEWMRSRSEPAQTNVAATEPDKAPEAPDEMVATPPSGGSSGREHAPPPTIAELDTRPTPPDPEPPSVQTTAQCTPRLVSLEGASELPLGGADRLLRPGNATCAVGGAGATLRATIQLCGGQLARVRRVDVDGRGNNAPQIQYEFFGALEDQRYASLGTARTFSSAQAEDVGELAYLRVHVGPWRSTDARYSICKIDIDQSPVAR